MTTQKQNQFGMEATLNGRLSKEIRVNENATNFTIAVNMANKDGSKSSKPAIFIDVACYDEAVQKIAKGLTKGQLVEVKTNFLSTRENVGKDGKTYFNIRIVANAIKATPMKIKNK